VFYVVLEVGAFGGVIALRGPLDGGTLADYRGAGRKRPWIGVAFALALVGLAGLPPGLAGLFAKVVVVRSLVTGGAAWLAIVVGVNAVIGLAYYARVIATLYASEPDAVVPARRLAWPLALTLIVVTVAGLVIGFAPNLILNVAAAR
jgi:NADH-quinone oxidoreductase subunit N